MKTKIKNIISKLFAQYFLFKLLKSKDKNNRRKYINKYWMWKGQ